MRHKHIQPAAYSFPTAAPDRYGCSNKPSASMRVPQQLVGPRRSLAGSDLMVTRLGLSALISCLLPLMSHAQQTQSATSTARLLRLNYHYDMGAALLEPLVVKSQAPPPDAVDEYMYCVSHSVKGEALRAKITEFQTRFGERAALYVLRARLEEEKGADAALLEIERGLKAYPENAALAAMKGYLLLQLKSPGAEAYLRESIERQPRSDVLHYWLGEAYRRNSEKSGNREKALDEYARAAELTPGWASPLLGSASVHLAVGAYAEAYRQVVAAEKCDPDSVLIRRMKYGVLRQMNPPPIGLDQIFSDLEDFLTRRDRDADSLDLAIGTYELFGQKDRAASLLDELKRRFPKSETTARVELNSGLDEAMRLLNQGSIAEAEAKARALIQTTPEPPLRSRAYHVLVQILTKAGDKTKLAEALDRWSEIADLRDTPVAPALAARTWLVIARGYLDAGVPEKAVLWARRAQSAFENTPPGYEVPQDMRRWVDNSADELMARAYFDSGRYGEAGPLLQRLLETFPASDSAAEWHRMLGVLATQEKDWDAAKRHLEAAYRQSNLSPAAEAALKEMYLRKSGGELGWSDYVDALRRTAKSESQAQVLEQFKVAPEPLPQFELKRFGTEASMTSKGLLGKTMVLNLWASWCLPCRSELPEFQKFYDKHKNDPAMAIMAINVEEPAGRVEQYLKNKNFTFPVLMDPKAGSRFRIEGIPLTLIVDPKGRVRFRVEGYNPRLDYTEMLEWLVAAASAAGAQG
ncbi:MAG: redoxin domain-containing protein [Acidobacteriota bacterium]